MRNNTPVTQRELDYDEDLTLMSVTDTQSHIRYANAAFTQISGFDCGELAGQPHNLVRHPDMPSEAFADMWESLRDGRPWVGLVKNRCKNGDHYWVRANVAPMVRRGRVTGYISVRTKPARDEIATAEKLYAEFREGRGGSRRFRRGLIVRTGAWAFLSLLQRISVAARIHLALAFVVLGHLGLLAALGMEAGALGMATGTTLLVASLADFWLQGQLTRPLRQAARQAQAVAAGSPGQNLELNRIDEIGVIMRSINQAGLNLRALVDDIDSQVEGLQGVGQQIGRSGNELAARTEQSASGLEQTAASMEELTSTFSQNTETARQASNLAQGASQAAVQGGEVVSQVVEMMQRITTSSKKIADIIAVIDGIAFQTNILALNAAVEAARAGEQGRGFAVVATEVRALAQRSASAAKEIKSLIDASVDGVQAGSVLVEQAGVSMENIVREVQRVTGLIGEITAASLEQSNGVAQINEAVAQLDQVTQQNATMVDENVGAAHSLIAQAERLGAAISVYKSRS